MEQFIDHISAQTETIKNTLKNDDNKEAFENILDEVISTFNPVLEVLNLHVDQTNPTTSPIRVLNLSESICIYNNATLQARGLEYCSIC